MKFNGLFNWPRNEADDGEAGGGSQASTSGTLLSDGQAQSGGQAQSLQNDDGATKTQQSQAASQGGAASQAAQQSQQTKGLEGIIDAEGKFKEGWLDKLPESLQEHRKHFEKYQSLTHALEHTRNLQQLLGKKADAVVIPKEGAPKEEWDAFRAKIGVPENPDGYELKAPKDLPDGVEINESELKEVKQLAHEIGLTPQQLAKLHEWDLGRVAKMAELSESRALEIEREELTKNEKILKDEWKGKDFDTNRTIAIRAARTFGYSAEDLATNPIFRNAEVIKILHKAGRDMDEDKLASGDNGSPMSLKSRAQDIINNPDNPEYKLYWGGDETINEKVRNWMRA